MSSSSSNSSSSSSGSSSSSTSSFLAFPLAALPRPLADVGAGAGVAVLDFDPLSFLGNISSSSSSSETFCFFFLPGVFLAGRPRLPGVFA